jgi:hypothetical protein
MHDNKKSVARRVLGYSLGPDRNRTSTPTGFILIRSVPSFSLRPVLMFMPVVCLIVRTLTHASSSYGASSMILQW